MDPADLDVDAEASETVVWAATEPGSGRFSPTETRSGLPELSERFNELRWRGQGYLEVRRPGQEHPVLTVGFRGHYAVIHLFTDAEEVSLLRGDDTVASAAAVEVPILDDAAVFTGDFVMDVERGWDRVRSFVRMVPSDDLGQWWGL